MNDDKKLLCNLKKEIDLFVAYDLFIQSLKSKKISYIPYMINIESLALQAKSKGISISTINQILRAMNQKTLKEESEHLADLQKMNTISLIIFTEKLYNEKITNEDIKSISAELKTRNDLFEAFIEFTNNKTEFLSDLYYWRPDLEICDVISLLLSLFDINKLISKYKDYLCECFILQRNVSNGLYKLLRERFNPALFTNLNVITKDTEIYKTSRINKAINTTVSKDFWTDENIKYEKSRKALIVEKMIIPEFIDGDMLYTFCDSLSYVDVTIEGKHSLNLIIPVKFLEDFYNGCKKYKEYWFKKGIIDENGKFIL